jgi:hypothetical protein
LRGGNGEPLGRLIVDDETKGRGGHLPAFLLKPAAYQSRFRDLEYVPVK